jgi:CHAT domain-containing protein/spore maturation protein SpmA
MVKPQACTRRVTALRPLTIITLAALLLSAPPVLAANPAPDRTALDAMVTQIEAAEADADPLGYRKLADAILAEARRLYPEAHPEVAARLLYTALANAQVGEMDAAEAMIIAILPRLEKVRTGAYRRNWRDALSLRAYIHNFRGQHDAAFALFEQVVADYEDDAAARGSRDYAIALSNLAASLNERGRLDAALERNAQAVAIGLTLKPVPGDVAIWHANRVFYLYAAGRTDEAVAAAHRGLAMLTPALGADHPSMSNLYANLGAISLRLGRPNDAMPLIRKAFELVEKANGGPNQNSATMRVQFAQALLRAGRNAEAIAFLGPTTPIIAAQLGPDSDRALVARDTLVAAMVAEGQAASAEPAARELVALRDARLPEGHRDRFIARDNLARALFAQGKWADARTAGAEAAALRAKVLPNDHPDLLVARAYLLRVEDRGDFRPGAELVADARALFDQLTFNAGLARGSAQAERQRPAYGWLAEIFARRGAVDDAFAAQQWAARTSLDDTQAIAAAERAAANDPVLAAALAERRALIAARQGLDARLDANLARPDPGFDLAALAAARDANRAAIADAERALGPDQLARLVYAPVPLAAAQAGGKGGEAGLMATAIDGAWLVTVITAERTSQAVVTQRREVDGLAARLRASAAPGNEAGLDRAAASGLFAALLPGDLAMAVRRAKRLSVVANGALGAVPFGLLASDRAGRVLLLDRTTVVRRVGVPRLASRAAAAGSPSLVALGGVPGAAASDLMALRSAGTARVIADLPDLPNARRELAALAEAFGQVSKNRPNQNRLLIGTEATEAALRRASVPPGSVLAFATHGLLSGELDGLAEPALLLSPEAGDDGLLRASEIGGLNLPAWLVILSACNTAGASAADRPQLSGLVQAFMLAGSQRVMASHWPVRDDAARRLSVAMVRAVAAGEEPAAALRRAVATVRKGRDGEAALTNPAQWAAFELFEAD